MSLSSPVPSWLDALQYNPVHEQDAKVFLREVVLFTCFFLLVLSLALGLGLYWRKRPNVKGSSLSGAGVPVNSIPFVVFVLTLSMAIAIVTALPVTVFALLAVAPFCVLAALYLFVVISLRIPMWDENWVDDERLAHWLWVSLMNTSKGCLTLLLPFALLFQESGAAFSSPSRFLPRFSAVLVEMALLGLLVFGALLAVEKWVTGAETFLVFPYTSLSALLVLPGLALFTICAPWGALHLLKALCTKVLLFTPHLKARLDWALARENFNVDNLRWKVAEALARERRLGTGRPPASPTLLCRPQEDVTREEWITASDSPKDVIPFTRPPGASPPPLLSSSLPSLPPPPPAVTTPTTPGRVRSTSTPSRLPYSGRSHSQTRQRRAVKSGAVDDSACLPYGKGIVATLPRELASDSSDFLVSPPAALEELPSLRVLKGLLDQALATQQKLQAVAQQQVQHLSMCRKFGWIVFLVVYVAVFALTLFWTLSRPLVMTIMSLRRGAYGLTECSLDVTCILFYTVVSCYGVYALGASQRVTVMPLWLRPRPGDTPMYALLANAAVLLLLAFAMPAVVCMFGIGRRTDMEFVETGYGNFSVLRNRAITVGYVLLNACVVIKLLLFDSTRQLKWLLLQGWQHHGAEVEPHSPRGARRAD